MIGTIIQQLSEQESVATSEEGLNINLDEGHGDSGIKRKLDRLGFNVEILNSVFEEFKGITTSKLNNAEDELLRIEKILKYDEHEYFITNNDVDLHKEFYEINEREDNIQKLLRELLDIKHKELNIKEIEQREKEREQDLAAESGITPEIIAKTIHESKPEPKDMCDDIKNSIKELKDIIENIHGVKESGMLEDIKSGLTWGAAAEAARRGATYAWKGTKYIAEKAIKNIRAGSTIGLAYDIAQEQIGKISKKTYAENEAETRKRLGLADDAPVTKEQVTQTMNLKKFEQEQLQNKHWTTSGKASESMLQAIMGPETSSKSTTDPKGFIFTTITPEKNRGEASSAYGPFQITKSFFEDNINRNELTDKEKEYYDRLISAQTKMLQNSKKGIYNDPVYGYGKSGDLGNNQEDRQLYYNIAEKAVANNAKKFKSYDAFIQSYRGRHVEEDPGYFAKINKHFAEAGTSGEEVFKRLKNPELDVPKESKSTREGRTDRENTPIDLGSKEEPIAIEEHKISPRERTDRENNPIDVTAKEVNDSHAEKDKKDESSNLITIEAPKPIEEHKISPRERTDRENNPIDLYKEEQTAPKEPIAKQEESQPKAVQETIDKSIPETKAQVNVVPIQPVINQQVAQQAPQKEVRSAPSSKDPEIRNSEPTLMNILYNNLNIHSVQELNRQLA